MDWIERFEQLYEAEARVLKSGEKLDEFVPPVRPKEEEDSLEAWLRKRFELK